MSEFRTEKDSLGEVRVPEEALWGAQTQRAVENFPVSGLPMPPAFIAAVVRVKQGALGVMQDEVEEMLDPTRGLINTAQDGFNNTVETIESSIADQRERLKDRRRRLKQKYARLQTLMTELKGTRRWTRSLASSLSS